ncbi:MAG TPA: hypothetical protein H9943_01095 [Candidatus Ruthenibacterium avium]|uniref:Alpha-galactosidase NEW3 domain-containing protein n=1 Tax=Candidatus Ruthenibacterium avium TaxID=2838751 RepID=A0A9D2RZW1_9FIRM|nr:hypothetical protein [Candidatus Ruthenibacterium avium]
MFRWKKAMVQKAAAGFMAAMLLLSGVNAFATASNSQATSTPNSTSSSESQPETTPPDVAGSPYITAYTVTDSAGNEKQTIAEGEKCRIIVAVVDPRITSESQLVLADGRALEANVKVVSTNTFATPSLGDIYTTTFKMTPGGLQYSIVLNDIAYLGGNSNELVLDLAYNDVQRPLVKLSQGISQCGTGTGQDAGKAPALIVKSASYGTGQITAGENFTLTAEILLSGNKNGAENVAVSLTLPEEITVVSGSSYQFIGNMKANQTANVQFELTASAVAKAGSYNISIDVTGNAQADGATLSGKMPVTVPVIQPDRFEISHTDIPENMVMGEETYGNIALINKGKGTVYNVEAKLEGEGFTVDEGASKFIGNINSGTQSTQDFSITPTQGGTISMQLVVSYEDESANIKTITKDFTITVDEMMPSDPGMDMGVVDIPVEEPAQGMPIFAWVIIGALLIAIGVTVAIILKKKRAKKRTAKLMEDDDEDI